MNCDTFIDRLDDLLADRLGDEERAQAARHLASCEQCRELRNMVAESRRALDDSPPVDLAAAILERTSGPACAGARERLGDHVDGSLEEVASELVGLHLERCEECAALSSAVARLTVDLPLLAELDPDERLVHDVLARTLPRRPRWSAWIDRVAEGWTRLLQRPRIAWEGAYVVTMALVIVFGVPSSPLAGVPRRALELAKVNPVTELKEPVEQIESRITSGMQSAWRSTSSKVIDVSRDTATAAAERSSDVWQEMKTGIGTLVDRFASEQEKDEDNRSQDEQDRSQGDEG